MELPSDKEQTSKQQPMLQTGIKDGLEWPEMVYKPQHQVSADNVNVTSSEVNEDGAEVVQ